MNNLQTHIENYLKYGHTQKCLDEKTLKAYRIDLNQFSQQTSLQDITKITSNTLEQYISLLHSNYKPKTAKRKIASLKAFFHYLEYKEVLEQTPLPKYKFVFVNLLYFPKQFHCILSKLFCPPFIINKNTRKLITKKKLL